VTLIDFKISFIALAGKNNSIVVSFSTTPYSESVHGKGGGVEEGGGRREEGGGMREGRREEGGGRREGGGSRE